MGKLVAAMGTVHAPQLFVRPPSEDMAQLDADIAAMRLIGKHNSPEVAQAYDWNRFPVIADIGGGIGGLLVDILDAHPSCRGLLFDALGMIQRAPANPDTQQRNTS